MPPLATISWIRNECDIIEAFVRHHAKIADRMIIVLHRSEDNTPHILEQLQEEGLPLELRYDLGPYYRQAETLTSIMYELTAKGIYEWILPLDADEFLVSSDGSPMQKALGELPENELCLLPWRTYVPHPTNDPKEQNVLRRIQHRCESEVHPYSKILIPSRIVNAPDLRIGTGSHALLDGTGKVLPASEKTSLILAHFPVRSEKQIRTKILSGWPAQRDKPGRIPGEIFHWEQLFDRCRNPAMIDGDELKNIAIRYGIQMQTDIFPDPPLVRDSVSVSERLRYISIPLDPLQHPAIQHPTKIPSSSPHSHKESADTIHVASIATQNYTPGLAVMMRSLIDHVPFGTRISFNIIDGCIHPETKRFLLTSFRDTDIAIRFLCIDQTRLAHLPCPGAMSPLTYTRLLLPTLLPELTRVLFLDPDLLILDDINILWNTDLRGFPAAAVQDMGAHTVSSHYSGLGSQLQSLGIHPETPYCNGGVLLIDLEYWRQKQLGEQMFHFITSHPEAIGLWDQDGLNAFLAGRWLPLDPRWNVSAEAMVLFTPGWIPPPHLANNIQIIIDEAKIVHFVLKPKPWHPDCPHPKTPLFFHYLDRTAWKGWRPHSLKDAQPALTPIKQSILSK